MNSALFTGTYVGETYTEMGVRFLNIVVPKIGNSGADVPLYVLPNICAGETMDVFQPGVKLLVGGRLYPNKQDYKMYLVPNQAIQLAGNLNINRVNISGGVGFIAEKNNADLFVCTVMCSSIPQVVLGYNSQDSLSFRIESWGDDAKRMGNFAYVGRQVSIEGALRYTTWTTNDGSSRSTYQIRTKSNMYTFFGKNKKKEEEEVQQVQPIKNQQQYVVPPEAKKYAEQMKKIGSTISPVLPDMTTEIAGPTWGPEAVESFTPVVEGSEIPF